MTLIAILKREPPQMVTAKVRILNGDKLISGVACRAACQTISQPEERLTASKITMECQGVGCCPTSSSPYIKVEQAIAEEAKPVQSKGRCPSSRVFPIQIKDNTMPIRPSGTLRKNIQRQEAYVVMKPPIGGPSTGATKPGQVIKEVALKRCCFSVLRKTTNLPTG